jgi:hypothetical protein
MDIFDLFPMGGPGLPGDRLAKSPAEEVAAAVGTLLLPMASFCLVLFTGIKEHTEFVVAIMPALAWLLAFVLARVLDVSIPRALLIGFVSATMMFMANLGALVLAAIGSFFSTF